ncbi:MAG: GIY-YIG nuclease family protein, partial [candidate division Zixibacteria bacterium]|nr:GIY-YIG nuclease family protein [candidate division Zixibacteria bacterium]
MSKEFFPPRPDSNPTIYAYEDTNPQYDGLLKVGYTTVDVQGRVAQQYPTKKPGKPPYKIVLEESAMRNDGTAFTDHDVHRSLKSAGVKNPDGEWFKCTVDDVRAAVVAVRTGEWNEGNRTLDFTMRPEQKAAVEKTAAYLKSAQKDDPDKTPHFLWNAKMRFGKTFAAYRLAKKMNWRKVLVLTFKPAVRNAWEDDLKQHIDFKGWQFIKPGGLSYEEADKKKPLVYFGSFQDHLGKNKSTGGIKTKNEWVHTTHWDCVILDEYHYGAWRESAKDLFEAEDKKEVEFGEGEGIEYFDEEIMPITTNGYLYLSGTPFRAITSGEFIEEQIFNWTYSDEQRAKQDWQDEDNPYASLPRMVLMTYQMPDDIKDIAMQGEYDEFDLNVFFSAEGTGENAKFKYQDEVQKWLDLIRGAFQAATIDNLKLGAKKPPMPFSDVRLLNVLSHTFWFLPSVASCYAMRKLLWKKQNRFYRDYQVIVAAGRAAGIGVDALPPVLDAMDDPLQTKTITLSCGKLTTGVTVRPWTGIFMLRNSSTPETYFQAAFRVQSPWTLMNPDNATPNREDIVKRECYVLDFAPDRALRQIQEYSCRLNVDESNPE